MAKKILVVDDEPGFVELLTGILAAKGYAVSGAYSGRQAITRVNQEMPDLIILDIKMPHMSGYDVCQILRAKERFNDIPIIMLTALVELDNVKTGMSLGAVSYISKPFEQNTLLTMIHGLIGPGSPGTAGED
jgi:DNA-binding response OmpR family regulator